MVLRAAPKGSTFAVASLWSRRLTLFDAPNESQGPREKWSIDLAFAPQEVLFIEAGKQLVVTDAFGGTMAIVDAESERSCGNGPFQPTKCKAWR